MLAAASNRDNAALLWFCGVGAIVCLLLTWWTWHMNVKELWGATSAQAWAVRLGGPVGAVGLGFVFFKTLAA